jgi:hypothetical protein
MTPIPARRRRTSAVFEAAGTVLTVAYLAARR